MSIPEAIKGVLESRGCTQAWVARRMNSVNPSLNMNRTKFSAIMCGNRKMTGDELLAFCKAIEINPDVLFADRVANEETEPGKDHSLPGQLRPTI